MKLNVSKASKYLAILTIALFAKTTQAQSTTKDSSKVKTATITYSVSDMDCKTDSKMVETALYRKKGVKSVKTVNENITIIYQPDKVKPDELKSIIENTGTCEDPNAKVHKVKIKIQ
ncbi:MAG: heavy metal-associated domain-containing protein [bacterium]|nr:heavy metal-associated domain-containing protein [bacterium]